MYLAVDVGGSKTLMAVFEASGKIIHEIKFETSKKYNDWLQMLARELTEIKQNYNISACCCALPDTQLDRTAGLALAYGNLDWTNTPVRADIARFLPDIPIFVENDAKLAGLYEAITLNEFNRVLYLTIGTGLGIALIVNGVIDIGIGDAGGRGLVMEYDGKLSAWDDIASGRALKQRFGQKASEITDPGVWQEYVKPLARGIELLAGTIQPEVIIIGGGVGAHFDKFDGFLREEMRKYETAKIKMPPVRAAKLPEEAVVYGCYEYIKRSL